MANEQLEDMKKKLVDKDTINKVYIKRIGKLEQEVIKLKEKNKKLQTKLKQAKIKLEEARDGAVNLIEENSQTSIEQCNKGPEFQDYLNNYIVGAFNIAYKDIKRTSQ